MFDGSTIVDSFAEPSKLACVLLYLHWNRYQWSMIRLGSTHIQCQLFPLTCSIAYMVFDHSSTLGNRIPNLLVRFIIVRARLTGRYISKSFHIQHSTNDTPNIEQSHQRDHKDEPREDGREGATKEWDDTNHTDKMDERGLLESEENKGSRRTTSEQHIQSETISGSRLRSISTCFLVLLTSTLSNKTKLYANGVAARNMNVALKSNEFSPVRRGPM